MTQEQIKELLERIRSKKNNETNELVVAAEEASLNTTTEAALSVASARVITTATISADNYLTLESFDEDGNAFDMPMFGNYYGTNYILCGALNVSALLSANNISLSNVTEYELCLYANGGNYYAEYDIYDGDGEYIGSNYGETELYVPLKDIYNTSGKWEFILVPDMVSPGYLYMPNVGNLEVTYNTTTVTLTGISITKAPNKTKYMEGETFNKTGMVVTATYSNGTTKTVEDYIHVPSGVLTTSNSSVTISYMEGGVTKTANVSISVEALEVDAPDYKQHYLEGSLGETSYRVNLRTGRIDFNKTIKKLSGNKSPLSLRMVYNTSTNVSSVMTGQWKLNIEQKIIQKDANTLYYIDVDFRIHTFKKLANSLYYDTDHTGMLIRGNSGNYVLTDDCSIEMLFDSSNRLTTIRKYSKASVIYTTIVYNDNGSITITDGMGRSVSVTSSAIDTAMLTYSNGDLTQIADSAGETVNYTYDSANNLATITANGQSVAFTYDSNRRVTQILYKIGSNQIKKQLLTYADSVTQVKEIKYPDKGSVAYTITCYKFDVEGNLITTFEKDNTEASEKILKTKYFSPDPYENYVLNLNGKESDSGMYYQNNGDDVVGYFQDPPTANAGEQYVLFAMLDREKLFSGISNGHLEIWLEDGTGDVENPSAKLYFDNTPNALPFEHAELQLPSYSGSTNLFFKVFGNFNADELNMEDIHLCKSLISTQTTCLKTSATAISGTKYTEKNASGDVTWTKIERCILSNVSDCQKVTAADWQLTEQNMAKAGSNNFVVWYNDLGGAVYKTSAQAVNINNETSTRALSTLTCGNVTFKNNVTVFEYIAYNADGTAIVTQNENKSSYQAACASYLDSCGRAYKTVTSKGVTTQTVYDDYDRVTKTTSTSSLGTITTSTVYTDSTSGIYTEKYTDEYGKVWTYTYDYTTGDLKSMTDPKGYTQTYTYDTKRRPIKVAQSTSENTLAYTSNDRISTLTHDTGAYAFTYDGYQQISNVKYNNATLLTKTYTLTNDKDMVLTTYANNGKITCVSDRYGNPLSVTDTQKNKTLLSYVYGSIKDDVGNVTEQASENKGEILRKKCHQGIDNPFNVVYTYNALKWLTNVERSDGFRVNYTYDIYGRILRERLYDGNESIHYPLTYSYTYRNGDTQISDKLSTVYVELNAGEMHFAYSYDPFERVSQKSQSYSLTGYDDFTISYAYTYDKTRISGLNTTISRNNYAGEDSFSYSESLAYDDAGNILQLGDVTYQYDNRNRLIQEENTALNRKYVFTYNDGGNITSKKEYNKNTGALLHTYSYSYSNDRLTSFDGTAITYDACGNPLSYKGNTLTWTRGRLLSQYGNITFQYDGEGFRRKKVNGSNTSIYYYENGRLLCEERISGSNRNKLYFVYSNGENVGYLYDATLYYFRKNALGDVVALYDSEGTCVATYKYDAWGNCTIGTNVDGLADLNPIRYRGYYYDTEANLYYLQTRYYDPQTGRFISPDTVEYLDPETIHGLNLYAYGLNNPIMYVDPTGHLAFFVLTMLIGAAIGFGITAAVDYCDDGEVFNGSVHWGWYLGATLVGAAIGAGIGMAISYSATGSIASSTGQVFTGLFKSTSLYRTVSSDEFVDIKNTSRFNQGPNSMEGKFFAKTQNGAKTWGKGWGQSNYVKIKVPKSSLNHSSVTPFNLLDTIDDAYYFSDLDYLNSIIEKIWFF